MRDNEEAVCGFGFGDEYAESGMVKAICVLVNSGVLPGNFRPGKERDL